MDTITYFLSNSFILLICIATIVLILAIVTAIWFRGFSEERRYILMEMNRSGLEGRKHWKKRLWQLYASQIPLIGPFLCRKIK